MEPERAGTKGHRRGAVSANRESRHGRGKDGLAWAFGYDELRERLGRAGIETATDYAWARRIDALEQVGRPGRTVQTQS